jgi:hypothetical protein
MSEDITFISNYVLDVQFLNQVRTALQVDLEMPNVQT